MNKRLLSLDLFRGITMFLLVAEGTLLYEVLLDHSTPGGALYTIALQFHHHPWNGLRFWDLIQPFFMFIVGVAMAYSITKRLTGGSSWMQTFWHMLVRCLTLLLFGLILHCGYRRKVVFELWNVLSQLSFTIMLAFLIFRLRISTQFIISIGLLVLTEFLYRFTGIEGFDKPFVQGENFGAWMDTVLMGKINGDGWVAINCIPTAAHTIWGVLAGKLLQSTRADREKMKWLILTGLAGLLVGYLLDWTSLTPIIKRICTSSFVLASGGWCMLGLALCYWIADMRGQKAWMLVFTVIGMNSIFIYMFGNTVGYMWLNEFMMIFTGGFLGSLHAPEGMIHILNALLVFGFEWYICYWLYQRKIFFKI